MRFPFRLWAMVLLVGCQFGLVRSARAQCGPNPRRVTSFSISPGTIMGDGYQVAIGTFAVTPTEGRGTGQRNGFTGSCIKPSEYGGTCKDASL
jgi:hypothetical protein